LKAVLGEVPDNQVPTLIAQLVEATTFLEKLDIVHRDIKPENIHVSEDFSKLKLIDLGVARGLSLPDEEAEEATDHGHKRPFIATAQYSSPEYLFRLDAPSPDLWRALNLYQVGAVLHDLINKKPLFEYEVGLGNKWLVARAVLTKAPIFPDSDPLRLATLKALATRCLAKDMATRLRIVAWSDFTTAAATDSLAALKSKLKKGKGLATQLMAATHEKLRFERDSFEKRFCEIVRTELIAACAGEVKVALLGPREGGYTFEFAMTNNVTLVCEVNFAWTDELQPACATIALSGVLRFGHGSQDAPKHYDVAVATINQSEDVIAMDVSQRLAELIGTGVDMLDGVPDHSALNGTDIALPTIAKG
jgi:serine/threonine-protein kinase